MKVRIIDDVLQVIPETDDEVKELKFWKMCNTRVIGKANAYCAKAINIIEEVQQ